MLAAVGAPKRAKCKSPMGCKDFAEPGQNFCEKHRCNSYGCKEHGVTLSEPGWLESARSASTTTYSSSSSGSYSSTTKSRSKNHLKFCAPFCKKHICQRILTQYPKGKWGKAAPTSRYSYSTYSSSNYSTEDRLKYFYCTNERLASGKYCLEHACKVATCGAMRWESWADCEGYSEYVVLDCGETCKAHSAKDPDTIQERTGQAAMTSGERIKAREEAKAAAAAEKADGDGE